MTPTSSRLSLFSLAITVIFFVSNAQATEGPESISLGNGFGCGLAKEGVRCWGESSAGQCGVVDKSVQNAQQITGTEGAEQLATGYNFACVLVKGALRCWGGNRYGQLGTSESLKNRTSAEPIAGLTNVEEVALANFSGCARKQNGSVWCWGYGGGGQFATNKKENHSTPIQIPGVKATRLFAGHNHFCSLDDKKELWCWGANAYGQAGSPRAQRKAKARIVLKTGEIADVALGDSFSCVRNSDGHVRCWGSDLANDGFGGPAHIPRIHPKIEGATDLELSGDNLCYVSKAKVFCLGVNRRDELQVPTNEAGKVVIAPSALPGVSDAVEIKMRSRAQCYKNTLGVFLCWGWNRQSRNIVGVGSRESIVKTPTLLQW